MTSNKEDCEERDTTALSSDDLLEELVPFEPYTTDELVAELEVDRTIISKLLDKLNRDGIVKKKKPRLSPTIWIREPPMNSCSGCGRKFEVKYRHAVLASVHYCPQCGNRL